MPYIAFHHEHFIPDYMRISGENRLKDFRDGNIERAKANLDFLLKCPRGRHGTLHMGCCLVAIEKGYIHILKLVFDKKYLKGYPEEIDEYENSVYMRCVLEAESVEGVDFLLSQGLKLFTLNSYAWSSFIYCVQHDKKNILKYIITLPQMQYPKYQLCFAAGNRDDSILKKSLEYPELLSEIDKSYYILGKNFPPLYWCSVYFFRDSCPPYCSRDLDCVKLLVEAGADIKSCTKAITLAAESQDVETILYLMDQGVGLDAYNLTDTLVTLCGMKYGDEVKDALNLKCIKRLIEAGADPHAHVPDYPGRTPLSASIGQNREVFDYILDLVGHGVGLDAHTLTHTLIALCGMTYGDLKCIKRVIEAGADPHAPNDQGDTPLSASIGKNRKVFDYILDLNLDKSYIDVQCGYMKIPILSRIIMSYPSDHELLEKILKTGCNVNRCMYNSNTLVMHASGKLNYNLVKLLLDYGADVNACNDGGKNAGICCLEYNDDDDVEEQKTYHSKQKNCILKLFDRVMTLGNYCVERKKFNHSNQKIYVLKLLVDRGMTLDNEYNLLLSAVKNFDSECIKLLLDYGADVNICNNGKNAGNYCLECKKFNHSNQKIYILKLLIDRGLPLNNECSLLISAFENFDLECIKLLLDYGADVNICNNGKNAGNYWLECKKFNHSNQKTYVLKLLIDHGMTLDNEYNLLLSAFESFDLECIKLLLETDIEKDTIGDLDQNILHLAANTPLPYDVYLMFLKKVKNINQKDRLGRTPLHMAVVSLNLNLLQLLLDFECDVNTMGNDGGSALYEIARRGHVGLTRAILKAGARPEKLLKGQLLWLIRIHDKCLTLVLENGGDVLLDIPSANGIYIIAHFLNKLKIVRNKGNEWTLYNLLTYNPSLTNLTLPTYDPAPIFPNKEYFDVVDLLYQSGAPKSELVKNSSDDVVELFEERIGDYTLKSRCRRIIRQTLGLGIKEKLKRISLPEPLNDFLLLKDIIHESYFQLD